MALHEVVELSVPTRELRRTLRRGKPAGEQVGMPESGAWKIFIELRRREEEDANAMFLRRLRSLHGLRSIAGSALSCDDPDPDEHRLVDDDFLANLWKAYKKCIRLNRTGPASQLLRDIEERLETIKLAA